MKEFHAPTAEEAANSPGYKFAQSQMIDGLDKSAAWRGTVLSGGHKADIMERAAGLASQTYGDTYTRSLNDFMTNYNVFRNDKNDVWGRYNDLSQRGTSAASTATA